MCEHTSERPAFTDTPVTIVRPGDGKAVQRRHGEQTVIKIAEAETHGAYALRENVVPGRVRRRPPAHPPRCVVEQATKAALGLADRAYLLERGTIVLDGTADAVAADPRIARGYVGGPATGIREERTL